MIYRLLLPAAALAALLPALPPCRAAPLTILHAFGAGGPNGTGTVFRFVPPPAR